MTLYRLDFTYAYTHTVSVEFELDHPSHDDIVKKVNEILAEYRSSIVGDIKLYQIGTRIFGDF